MDHPVVVLGLCIHHFNVLSQSNPIESNNRTDVESDHESKWNGKNERTNGKLSTPSHLISSSVLPNPIPIRLHYSGGYAFFETSQLPDSPKAQNTVSAMLTSPVLKSTGSEGFCVTFSYAMDGLSTDKLRLLLQVCT